MIPIGKKILIVGVSASGKTLFSRLLSDIVGIPVTHVDALTWRPGWNYVGDEAAVQKLDEVSRGDQWLMEGFIEKGALSFILERADTILYLDYPRIVTVWHYLKRSWLHRKNPRPELQGSPDRFSFEFLLRIWRKKEVYRLNQSIQKLENKNKILFLRSPAESAHFLTTLQKERVSVR